MSGYPEAHPDAIVEDKEQMEKNYWSDIQYLKEKLDAGADFVVTQLFYDVDRFIAWVKDCRSIGITAPIIPGIMPIMAYGGFQRMTSFCKTIVPQEIRDRVEALKDDDAGLKAYGVQLGSQMCRKILDAKVSPGVDPPSPPPPPKRTAHPGSSCPFHHCWGRFRFGPSIMSTRAYTVSARVITKR